MSTEHEAPPTKLPFVIDYDYEGFSETMCDLVLDEDSDLWRHMAELVEEHMPGIKPYDRREFIWNLLAPMRKAIADEFA